jgi:hypothetical protein
MVIGLLRMRSEARWIERVVQSIQRVCGCIVMFGRSFDTQHARNRFSAVDPNNPLADGYSVLRCAVGMWRSRFAAART